MTFLTFFLINIQLAFFEYNRGIVEILWSVCIEEQFYLIWAPLVKVFQRYILSLSLVAIGIGFMSPFFFNLVAEIYPLKLKLVNYFFTSHAFTYFGFGSLGSWIFINKKKLLASPLFGKFAQVIVLALIFILMFKFFSFNPIFSKYLYNLALAALFFHLILTAISSNSLINLETPILSTLGKITYGIYLYHTFVLQITLRLFYKLFPTTNFFVYEILFVVVSFGTTVLISYLSFQYFEKYFLGLKRAFR